jgi:YfiH family protein
VQLVLRSELLTRAGFRHGFSLRTGGVSRSPFEALNLARNLEDDPICVAENHARLAAEVGYAPEHLFEVSQVHGREVLEAHRGQDVHTFRAREADAVWSREADLAVAVRVADCVPVLLACPATRMVCAVHAGWRGVVAEVLEAAVSALVMAGAERSKLLAAVGPHIGVEAFEVSDEVAAEIARAAAGCPDVVQARAPRPHVDLFRAVRAQLVRGGLETHAIERVAGCTHAEPERFYSFRRDGARSGRHLAVIVAGC